MKRTFLCILLTFFVLAPWQLLAGSKKSTHKGYRLEITIAGCRDTMLLLGDHYQGNQYVFDTAYRDEKGRFVFEDEILTLMPGVYFFCNPEGKNVEFVIHNEAPFFSFTTQEGNWTDNVQVKGSEENRIFFQYQQQCRRPYERQLDSAKIVMNSTDFEQFYHRKQHFMDSCNRATIKAYPKSLLTLMLNAERPVMIPATDDQGNTLSRQDQFEYFVRHYFDNVDLTDNALIRTPNHIFFQKYNDLLEKGLKGATPEVIISIIDPLIDRAKPAPEVFRYLVCELAEYYLTSNVMSYDAVYVHLIQRYYATGEAFWASPSNVDENVKRANTWEKLLIGKTAPELIMKDRSGNIHSLHQQHHKYTLLVFWSPTCGHCQLMIPSLYQKFNEYAEKYDIGAYAILSEPDDINRKKWTEFINKNEMHNPRWLHIDGGEANVDWHEVYDVEITPQIYLLDAQGKIIGKRLNAESFEFILNAIESR